ncbi:MAG: hypothetical protein AB7I48_25260, partial [Planctomycetaceae bacterium]
SPCAILRESVWLELHTADRRFPPLNETPNPHKWLPPKMALSNYSSNKRSIETHDGEPEARSET